MSQLFSTALAALAPPPDLTAAEPVLVTVDDGTEPSPKPSDVVTIPTDDGGVVIQFVRPEAQRKSTSFDANLAEVMGEGELANIASELLRAIDADEQSSAQRLAMYAKGIDMLGLKLEQPRGDAGTTSSPLEGMSSIKHPMLLEACLRFQSNARGELLPASGPVKVEIDSPWSGVSQEMLAEALENDLNHYLTITASEYYPDTDRMLFRVGLSGCGFKKVYYSALKRRPVSESVNPEDILVSDSAMDLASSGRVTHRTRLAPAEMKRMQITGAYRDIALAQPQGTPSLVEEKSAQVQGMQARQQRPEDQPFTVFECYCEWDLPGYEHEEDGQHTGIPLPYVVSLDKDSRAILAIRRNWDEDDELFQPKRCIVQYPYDLALGFYGIGLQHILGNMTAAATALWREMIDAGMFANFPGFIYTKIAGRQATNEFRVPPGGGVGFDPNGQDLRAAIMPLPYHDVTPGLFNALGDVTGTGQRVGGTAEIAVGEGKQDAPVGTTLALIEQATKIESAVHKRLYTAQGQELRIIRDLFAQDPAALWRGNKKSAVRKLVGGDDGAVDQAKVDMLATALADADLTPVADPNTPSHLHRIMKVWALKTISAGNPLYDERAVDEAVLRTVGWADPGSFFVQQPQQAPPDPKSMKVIADQQNNAQKNQIAVAELAQKNQIAQTNAEADAAADASKERVAKMNIDKELIIHNTPGAPPPPEAAQLGAPGGQP